MNRVNTALIAALAVQICLAVLMRLTGSGSSIGELTQLVEFDDATVTSIHIFGPKDPTMKDEQQQVQLVSDGGEWKLDSHFGYPVRAKQVDSFLRKILGAKSRQAIAKTAPRQQQLRVADDIYERKIVIAHSGGESTFYLGTPAGGRRAALRVAGSDEVHAVANLPATAASVIVTFWIETVYFKPAGAITSVNIDNAQGSFVVQKTGDEYQVVVNGTDLVPPAGKELDETMLNLLINRIKSVRVVEPADSGNAPTTGQITISVKTDQDEEYRFDAALDDEDYHHLRERGNPYAARVDKAILNDYFVLNLDMLIKDKPRATDAAEPKSAPPIPGPTNVPSP